VCISNIIDFTEISRFEVQAGLQGIRLIDSKLFSCFEEDNSIKIFELQHLAKNFTTSTQVINKIVPVFATSQDRVDNNSKYMIVQHNDNSIQLLTPEVTNPTEIAVIYPPPTVNDIKVTKYCMNTDKYYILLATGVLCVYKIEYKKDTKAFSVLDEMVE
jgi:hypothetical protein